VLDVQDPELREATLTVPYPSAQYTYQVIAFDGQVDHNESEPSDPASAITWPHLSARAPYSLDPSNSSKFADKGDRVYLVHEDQDRVWLAIGTKAIGNIDWEEDEYLLSDLLPEAWDPCIGLIDVLGETKLFCAFVGRDGQLQKDQIYALWFDPDDIGHTILAPRAVYTPLEAHEALDRGSRFGLGFSGFRKKEVKECFCLR